MNTTKSSSNLEKCSQNIYRQNTEGLQIFNQDTLFFII